MPVDVSEEPVSPAPTAVVASNGASTTVSRALRLIEDGVLDHANIDALCERLGIGARQLRRLFNQHVGASPVQVALVRRARFARRLIETTGLSMSSIATAAGFGSVRRFNAVINDVYGCPPSALRKTPRRGNGELSLHIAVEESFPWRRTLQVLEPWTVPGVEQIIDDRYLRTATFGHSAGEVCVTYERSSNALRVSVCSGLGRHLLDVVSGVRRLFDVDARTAEIERHLGRDPLLQEHMRLTPGLRLPGPFDHFETAVMMLLNQNTSPGDASELMDRIVDKYGKQLCTSQLSLTHSFPTPAALSSARLEALGVPKRRARSVQALAKAVHEGALRLDGAASLDAAVEGLRSIADVSTTTAQYVAMRVYREPDAFPSNNPWLRQAMSMNGAPLSSTELESHAESWRPWRAYGAMYLWASLLSDDPRAMALWGGAAETPSADQVA